MLSTIAGITALLTTGGGFLLRRRMSKNWITKSSILPQQFTKDQTIIITGGNTGVGYEAAKDLAANYCGSGGKIILACRNEDLGERAASSIRESTGNKDVDCMKLDLSSLDSIQNFAADLKARDEKVYALVCNAGVWVPDDNIKEKTKTKEGFEIHFGVNHLGHFALIQSIIPQMEQSGMDSRIIIVGSTLCKSGKIDMQKRDFIHDGRTAGAHDKNSFAPRGYCDSKLMNMLTCRELATKLQGSNISTYAVSPGFCSSRLDRNVQMPIYKKMLMKPLLRLFQRSSYQGALNLVFAVTEDKAKLKSGAMYQDGEIWKDGVELVDTLGDDLQKGLWDLSEELLKEKSER